MTMTPVRNYADELGCDITDAVERALRDGLTVYHFRTVTNMVAITDMREIDCDIADLWVAFPNQDLTGELVFGFAGSVGYTPCLFRDKGWFEGTLEPYNVRAVETVESFEDLEWHHPLVKAITNQKSYGCRSQGGLSGLYVITGEQIQALKAENERISREKAEKLETRRAQAEEERTAKFWEATTTGNPVVLATHMVDCDGSEIDCSHDVITVYAMPDGTTTRKRTHTW